MVRSRRDVDEGGVFRGSVCRFFSSMQVRFDAQDLGDGFPA